MEEGAILILTSRAPTNLTSGVNRLPKDGPARSILHTHQLFDGVGNRIIGQSFLQTLSECRCVLSHLLDRLVCRDELLLRSVSDRLKLNLRDIDKTHLNVAQGLVVILQSVASLEFLQKLEACKQCSDSQQSGLCEAKEPLSAFHDRGKRVQLPNASKASRKIRSKVECISLRLAIQQTEVFLNPFYEIRNPRVANDLVI